MKVVAIFSNCIGGAFAQFLEPRRHGRSLSRVFAMTEV